MKKAIVFKNVSKNYKQLKAVDGISLTIEKGEFFGLLGPNGAGKSTLINMMAGLVKPSNGSIDVMGFNVNKEYQEARHSVGICLLYTSPSPRDRTRSRMPSSA